MRNIRIDSSCYFWWAFLILLLPLRWLAAAISAAAVHELSHFLAVRILGGRVSRLTIHPTGAKMRISALSPWREMVAALAGPCGGLLLLCFAQQIPLTALCALIHSIWNLLPIYPLDGGRALRCCAGILLPEDRAERVCIQIGFMVPAAMAAFCVFLMLHLRGGWMPLLLLFPLIRLVCQKNSLQNST